MLKLQLSLSLVLLVLKKLLYLGLWPEVRKFEDWALAPAAAEVDEGAIFA